jgi:hypothetical protein
VRTPCDHRRSQSTLHLECCPTSGCGRSTEPRRTRRGTHSRRGTEPMASSARPLPRRFIAESPVEAVNHDTISATMISRADQIRSGENVSQSPHKSIRLSIRGSPSPSAAVAATGPPLPTAATHLIRTRTRQVNHRERVGNFLRNRCDLQGFRTRCRHGFCRHSPLDRESFACETSIGSSVTRNTGP